MGTCGSVHYCVCASMRAFVHVCVSMHVCVSVFCVAKWLKHLTTDQKVPCSSPTSPTGELSPLNWHPTQEKQTKNNNSKTVKLGTCSRLGMDIITGYVQLHWDLGCPH